MRRDEASELYWISLRAAAAIVACFAFVVRGNVAFAAARSGSVRTLPGLQADGSVLLPNQWSLRPAGTSIELGDFPVNLALNPDGIHAAVLHSGYKRHEVWIVDIASRQPTCKVPIDESFYGLAWSSDGSALYVSGASSEVVRRFAFEGGLLSDHQELRLRPVVETGVPTGLAYGKSDESLYVAEGWGQRVVKLDPSTGALLWTRDLADAAGPARTIPEAARQMPDAEAEAPFPYACVIDEATHRLYVSLWAKSAVLALSSDDGSELARWPVGDHPNEMVLDSRGRLFVAEANRNTVSVIDTANGRVQERLWNALTPDAPPGSMPNSVALSPDERQLFVANATNNTVAAFDVSQPGRAVALGQIPVGWFPTSARVSADGKTLLVVSGKGASSRANPSGPFPGDGRPRNLQEYIGGLMNGTLGFVALPDADDEASQYSAWSAAARAGRPDAGNASPSKATKRRNGPLPDEKGETSPVRYVIYVVKENRTYDQILGDLPEGNGDPRLCLFPERVTPNHHALARDFALLDNFYADGEVSADGHEWSLGAYATDFVEKTWPLNYGGRHGKIDYPSEGSYDFAAPEGGYLWDQAARAGLTYRSYGEFARKSRGPDGVSYGAIPILKNHVDPDFAPFDLNIHDVDRAARFESELKRFEREGEMPRLQVVRLGNDHTSGTHPGAWTPTAMVADNDLALGRLVEAVSRSSFWPRTAIFVLEDDAQNGPDHVDAHRIPAYVISPYTRGRGRDSTLYSTTSMLRTMELILGLDPMSQYDAAAAPMFAAFRSKPVSKAWTHRPAQVDIEARNTETAWGAETSEALPLDEADEADDIVLNEIVWRSVRGADSPMPAPVRAAFFRPSRDDDHDGGERKNPASSHLK